MSDSRQFHEILNDIRDGKETLYCSKHFYTPSHVSWPEKGCADCWRVFYWTLYAKQPDDQRQEFEEGLTMAVKHMQEHLANGTWDFKPNFKIEIEKEN